METIRDQFINVTGELKTQAKDENISGIEIQLNEKLRFSREIKTLLKREQTLLRDLSS